MRNIHEIRVSNSLTCSPPSISVALIASVSRAFSIPIHFKSAKNHRREHMSAHIHGQPKHMLRSAKQGQHFWRKLQPLWRSRCKNVNISAVYNEIASERKTFPFAENYTFCTRNASRQMQVVLLCWRHNRSLSTFPTVARNNSDSIVNQLDFLSNAWSKYLFKTRTIEFAVVTSEYRNCTSDELNHSTIKSSEMTWETLRSRQTNRTTD